MPTDGHSGFPKTGGSHIGAGRLFWYWGKAPCRGRAAPIVCPEESPLCFLQEGMPLGFLANPARRGLGASGKPPVRPQAQTPAPAGNDAPTPAREEGLQPYGALYVGKRVPSGHNRRRRLATRSSGKQQAERTAVRAASIVCPEESPLLAAIINNFDVKNSPLMGE